LVSVAFHAWVDAALSIVALAILQHLSGDCRFAAVALGWYDLAVVEIL